MDSTPGSGGSPGEGNGNPLQNYCQERSPWTEEPEGLQSTGSQRVRHNLVAKQQQKQGQWMKQREKWHREGSIPASVEHKIHWGQECMPSILWHSSGCSESWTEEQSHPGGKKEGRPLRVGWRKVAQEVDKQEKLQAQVELSKRAMDLISAKHLQSR